MKQKHIPDILIYTPGIASDIKPQVFDSYLKATACLWENKDYFIANILSCFENIHISPFEIQAILEGLQVTKLNFKSLLTVKTYVLAVKKVCLNICERVFVSDRYDLIEIHRVISNTKIDDPLQGLFRKANLKIKGVSWTPPVYSDLPYYWYQVYSYINNTTNNIIENALIIFLLISRLQFFINFNESTALLFANGYLMQRGYAPFIIPAEASGKFNQFLTGFYETGKADPILNFLSQSIIVDTANIQK